MIMSLLDDFITDIKSDVKKEVEQEVEKKESDGKGCFDGQYAKDFLDYCNKGGR